MKTYSSKSNAKRAAVKFLVKEGIEAPVEGTHFAVTNEGDRFAWNALGQQTKPAPQHQPEVSKAPTTEETKAPKTKGLKIQKDREERNGIKRPSEGGKCATAWAVCEQYYEETGMVPTPAPLKAFLAKLQEQGEVEELNTTNVVIELYQWRTFMGFAGRK